MKEAIPRHFNLSILFAGQEISISKLQNFSNVGLSHDTDDDTEEKKEAHTSEPIEV